MGLVESLIFFLSGISAIVYDVFSDLAFVFPVLFLEWSLFSTVQPLSTWEVAQFSQHDTSYEGTSFIFVVFILKYSTPFSGPTSHLYSPLRLCFLLRTDTIISKVCSLRG